MSAGSELDLRAGRRRHRRPSVPGRGAGARARRASGGAVASGDRPARPTPLPTQSRASTICQVRAGRLRRRPAAAPRYGVAEMALGIVQARRLLRRLAPDGGRRLWRLSLGADDAGRDAARRADRASTSRTPCSAAPTGCWRRASRRIATGFAETAGLRAADRSARRPYRQPGAPGDPRCRGDAPMPPPEPRRADRIADPRRQPGRAHLRAISCRRPWPRCRRSCAACLRVSQQARPEDRDGVTAQLHAGRHRRRGRELLQRRAGPARARASRDLPLRRLDRRRTGRRRPAGAARALSARRPTITRPPMPAPSPMPAPAGSCRKPRFTAARCWPSAWPSCSATGAGCATRRRRRARFGRDDAAERLAGAGRSRWRHGRSAASERRAA